ncbi:FAD-dependent oxidoreductase [Halomonas sp. CKK8]|uniref:NAD(P)/FAD-dependent oxidoreductase n=1 Tax=Halomonas sp. CKK8 TaxID=3036127 RepID=UPI0024155DDE|nr:FAD-dependent oxidoreductase [Halomonas sp. CKK8]WFM71002.1 FAD-dependent oxidoreductase [Halomonas sp. CKK8]
MSQPPVSTAIIGAGIAGLACGQALSAAGLPVHLFDKGRGPGGRMSSRRLPGAVVDLGAQFFSVRDPAFRRRVTAWREAGHVASWPETLWQVTETGWQPHRDDVERFIGTPRMSAVTRQLAEGLEVTSGTRIARLEFHDGQWWLLDQDDARHGPFARVVIAVPTPQAATLLAGHETALAEACEAVIQRPCWTAWARFDAPLPSLPGVDDDWQAVRLDPGHERAPADDPLRFVSRNDHKPGRHGQGESLSLLARLEWSEAHLELGAEAVARALLDGFRERLPRGVTLPEPTDLGAHLWRYAQPDVFAAGEAVNRDYRRSSAGLALCGDGWRGPRVEDAWLSGHHLGEALAADTP